ncbi:MAG: hypothetical protein PVSMB4_19510 [Ktedonobacterales bacterium]
MARAPHTPHPMAGEATLDRRLQWHIGYHLRQGARCSLLMLCLPPDGSPRADGPWPEASADALGTGSTTLAQVAGRLRPLLRRSDVVEVDDCVGIGVVLPGADAEGVGSLYRRLSHHLAEEPVRVTGGRTLERVLLTVDHASFDATSEPGQLAAVLSALTAGSSTSSLLLAVPVLKLGRGTPAGHPAKARTARSRSGHPRRAAILDHSRRSVLLGDLSTGGEKEALRVQADALGVPYVCLPHRLTAADRGVISPQLARELRAVPIGRTRGTLTVAMHDPTDAAAVQRLSVATGLRIFPVLVAAAELERALEQLAPGTVELVGPGARSTGA